MNKFIKVTFVPSGRGKAQCPPDPNYPEGIDLDISDPARPSTCEATLPYPARECGLFAVRCEFCKQTIAVTCAGRPDDPRTVKFSCNLAANTVKA